jgi:hypothetical protein
MQGIPFVPGKEFFEITLCLGNAFAFGQPPALSQAVNMGIYGKGGMAKTLRHDYACGFMAHTWQGLQCLPVIRDLASMLLDQNL